MSTHDTDQVLSAAVYAAVARAYDNERSIEDAADEILDAIEADRQRRGEPVAWIHVAKTWYGAPMVVITKPHQEGAKPVYLAPQPAEPAKVPSDAELRRMVQEKYNGDLVEFARAVLARYGQSAPKLGEEE